MRGREGGGEGREETGQVVQAGGLWVEGARPDSGAHRRPLVAAAGRTDCGR